jgi:hypothetical protein
MTESGSPFFRGVSVTETGLGKCSKVAPVAASAAIPTTPPKYDVASETCRTCPGDLSPHWYLDRVIVGLGDYDGELIFPANL